MAESFVRPAPQAEIKVAGPDGSSFAFPVGTPVETIEGAMRSHYATYKAPAAAKAPDERDSLLGKVDSVVRGAADTMTFGMADELAAAADATLNPILGTGKNAGTWGERFNLNKTKERATDAADADQRGGYRVAGQLGGGVAGGLGLAKAGMSMTANAVNAGKSLPGVIAASAKEGAILGGLHGAGSGEGLEGRLEGGAKGFGMGLALGAATPGTVRISVCGRP